MTIRSVLRTLLAVSALLVPASLAAQTSLSVGGGLTLSEVQVSTAGFDITPDRRIGFTAGVGYTRPLTGSVALQIGGAYVQKGYKLNVDFFGETASATAKLDYLELTALAKPTFPLGAFMGEGSSSFHLLAGPAVGISVSCSLEEEGETEDCADDLTAFDLGLLAGAGIQLGRFRLDATYTLGILDVAADSGDDDGTESLKNRSIAVQAGFVIPLGRGS